MTPEGINHDSHILGFAPGVSKHIAYQFHKWWISHWEKSNHLKQTQVYHTWFGNQFCSGMSNPGWWFQPLQKICRLG